MKKELKSFSTGTLKGLISQIPFAGSLVSGWDHYERESYERNIEIVLILLAERVENLEVFFNNEIFKTEEGKKIARKIFYLGTQIEFEDKQKLFVNALVNCAEEQGDSFDIEKSKFIDILKNLSYSSLLILAEIHPLFIHAVRREDKESDPLVAFPLVDEEQIIEKISEKFHPYIISSSLKEMEGQGLFSKIGAWQKQSDGKYYKIGGFANELAYTDFAAKFVEFITIKSDT
ncbi:hypothetical protein [Desulfosediminicola sp.]|uniref:hypothetical protein n=1 Tax=Desulfosediminicola sp. TaxID=2886825 RepID=UPI003AF317EB